MPGLRRPQSQGPRLQAHRVQSRRVRDAAHHVRLLRARHRIEPVVEYFPLSRVNEALIHRKAGKGYRAVVLENDLA